jgi:hypothetical protein
MLGCAMTRLHGPLLTLLLLSALAGTRLLGQSRAAAMVEHEDSARRMMGELIAASRETMTRGRAHPGLRAAFLQRFPQLTERTGLASDAVSYADDGDYLFALAPSSATGDGADGTGGSRQGFVLRAWPLDFGVTGDLEFHATDDGLVWEGQNSLGRSGTEVGFPPLFPEPELLAPGAGWTSGPGPAPAHR